jgi:anhydro-N-acetylmuramic acid kinase
VFAHHIIGLMSGTSLDGVDIAHCRFEQRNGKWSYTILHAETIQYPAEWQKRLATVENGTALEFVTTDIAYGHLLGQLTRTFIQKHALTPAFIASHGHTIFHQPDKKITSQIGRGSAIAAEAGFPVVCDFRSLDVALGGQGAPLVPIGDRLLFHKYDYCLNIGGFANISCETAGQRIAFDVSPANILLNKLAQQIGMPFDDHGALAQEGKIIPDLLQQLNNLPFYTQSPPKSLGKEWVIAHIHPMLNNHRGTVTDVMATLCEHIAMQIAAVTGTDRDKKLLITGGGAFNTHLVRRITALAAPEVIIPDDNTINYKEALIFAFLGLLRWLGTENCLKSVTGATSDNVGGAIYHHHNNQQPHHHHPGNEL